MAWRALSGSSFQSESLEWGLNHVRRVPLWIKLNVTCTVVGVDRVVLKYMIIRLLEILIDIKIIKYTVIINKIIKKLNISSWYIHVISNFKILSFKHLLAIIDKLEL